MKKIRIAVVLAAGLSISAPAFALDPFSVSITVGTAPPLVLGFTTVDDMIRQLDPEVLKNRYQDSSADPRSDTVLIQLNFRGLEGVVLNFYRQATISPIGTADQAPELRFQVPLLGIDFDITPTKDGVESRTDSLKKLLDLLKTDKTLLKKLLAGLARYSPIDPLAGNPNSLFGRKMKSDMEQGFTHKVSQVWGCGTSAFNFDGDQPILLASTGAVSDIFADAQQRAAELQAQNEFGIGVIMTNATAETDAGDYKTTAFLVPISYTAKLDSNPSHKIRFDFPIGYSDTEGAKAVSLGVGLAYTFPVSDVWTLTPAAGLGATGSVDLISAGGVNSLSVTSAYTWRLGNWALSMGNSIGKYSSMDLKFGDVEAAADISNTALSNGFILSGPNSLIAKNLVMEYSFTNTRISGDEVYTDQYNEVGVAIGHMGMDMGIIDNFIKFGVSYLKATGDGGDITATKLNLAARF